MNLNFFVEKATVVGKEVLNLSRQATKEIVDKSKEVGVAGYFYDTAEERLAEVKDNLDSKFDKEKIDGLKRLVAMMSKGRNVSEFFPFVVKNVASTSFEVRKLVYIYLLRYAEQEPDLALLSINTFQKDLRDKNPMIRAMALRVMSSIRVPVIVPLIMLGLKECVRDMSPYVRKAASTAIPKCFTLDPTQKEHLIEIIVHMLSDKSTVVLGSVISSFNQVCHDRFDLIHPHFRKLCRLLVDTDEWGQIEIAGLLLRYVRANFKNPAKTGDSPLDSDLRLLLDCCKTTLYSRNRSVVLSVVKVFTVVAPKSEWLLPIKALIRILSTSSNEAQAIILLNVLTVAHTYPPALAPFARYFIVYTNEPKYIYDLKLEILEIIADASNRTFITNEFKNYIGYSSEEFVVKTIQVFGRLACRMKSVSEECLSALMGLVSNKNETIVAEAVVVSRRLLQMASEENTHIAMSLVRSLDVITIPMARASILWLIGQYSTNPEMMKIAPDIFRQNVKMFSSCDEIVKLQVLNLGAKILSVYQSLLYPSSSTTSSSITSASSFKPKEANILSRCMKLFAYCLEIARFDSSYDVRDRARILKSLVYDRIAVSTGVDAPFTPSQQSLSINLLDVMLKRTAAPFADSPFANRSKYAIGSLSHTLNMNVTGYEDLPAWAEETTESSLRGVGDESDLNKHRVVVSEEKEMTRTAKVKPRVIDLQKFYEESSEEEEDEEEEDEEEDEGEEEDEEEEEEEES